MSNITKLQNFINWGQDIDSIENELEIFVE
jgi:hypothetical protein